MADLTEAEFEAAERRGHLSRETEPRAKAVRYDRRARRIVVDLVNGCTFAFPPDLAQGLDTATDEQLATVEILGAGYGLHWEELDVDFSVSGLLAGVFGTAAYMAGRAGSHTSASKAVSARRNGSKSGRPRKVAGA